MSFHASFIILLGRSRWEATSDFRLVLTGRAEGLRQDGGSHVSFWWRDTSLGWSDSINCDNGFHLFYWCLRSVDSKILWVKNNFGQRKKIWANKYIIKINKNISKYGDFVTIWCPFYFLVPFPHFVKPYININFTARYSSFPWNLEDMKLGE